MEKDSKWNKRSGADYAILKEDSYRWMFWDSNGKGEIGYISYR